MSKRIQVWEGRSTRTDGREAVAEATEGWGAANDGLDLLIMFCSTSQDAAGAAAAVAERFKNTPLIGCTTAGEHMGSEHYTGSLVLAGIRSPRVRWATTAVDLSHFNEDVAREASNQLILGLGLQRDDLSPQRHFCVVFVDGLSCKEEVVSSLMADALEGVPLLGGSAGDDLKFKQTLVFHGGRALASSAVFALADSSMPFEIIKHQHYTTSPRSLVITRADLPTRRVYEMDGYPAIEAYARALGLRISEVTNEITFLNPLTFLCDGEIYVRSIQRVEPDGSIIFYCGIEEGMVLSVGGHEDMEKALGRDITGLTERTSSADLFLSCNCILRALEAEKGKHHAALGETLHGFARHVIGFDTYGEQLNGLHINQTLVGLALRDAEEVSS